MQQAPQETDDIHRSRRPRWFESEEQEMQFSDHEFRGLEHRAHVPRSKSTSRFPVQKEIQVKPPTNQQRGETTTRTQDQSNPSKVQGSSRPAAS
ncbi:hypothetical protein MTO96_012612 [Rhipicephalus appendiculatus]